MVSVVNIVIIWRIRDLREEYEKLEWNENISLLKACQDDNDLVIF